MGSMANIVSSYSWELKNFGTLQDEVIYSPTFSTTHPSGKTLRWRLQLYPKGRQGNSTRYLSVYLQCMSDVEVSTKFSVSVLVGPAIEIFKKEADIPKVSSKDFCFGWDCYRKRFLFTDESIRLFVNDTFTFCCCIYSTNLYETVALGQANNSKPMDHFERFLETGDLSDVTFLIGKNSLKLHKAILGSMSSVFYSMFIGDNNVPNSVRVVKLNTHFSYAVMREMFRYIYARKVNDVKSIATDLYVAADKYQIDGLKQLCDEALCSDLNNDNALTRLQLAVTFDIVQLKSAASDFVVRQLAFFIGKEQFKRLTPDCKDELISTVADKLRQKF